MIHNLGQAGDFTPHRKGWHHHQCEAIGFPDGYAQGRAGSQAGEKGSEEGERGQGIQFRNYHQKLWCTGQCERVQEY